MTGLPYTVWTAQILKEFDLSPLTEMCKQQKAIMMYKSFHDTAPKLIKLINDGYVYWAAGTLNV